MSNNEQIDEEEVDEEEQIDEQDQTNTDFRDVQNSSKRPSTRKNYSTRQKSWHKWLSHNYPSIYTTNDKVLLPKITTLMITQFLLQTSRKPDGGGWKNVSTPKANHSAILDLFQQHRINPPSTYGAEWTLFHSGYANNEALSRSAGLLPTVGSKKYKYNIKIYQQRVIILNA